MNEYQKRMQELFTKLEGIRTAAEKEKRLLRPEEIEERQSIIAQIETLKAEEDLHKDLYGNGENRRHVFENPDGHGAGTRHDANDVETRLSPARGRTYRAMFNAENRELDRGGFKNFDEFLTLIHNRLADPRLIPEARDRGENRAMSEGIPSSGGFAVPEEFAAFMLDTSLETEIVRPRATVWPMKSVSLKVPGWDMESNFSSLFGGLVASWLAESGTATEVFAKLRRIQLVAKKLACYTSASNELIADGVSIAQQLANMLVATIGFYLDYSFIQGSGAGQPLGILNDPALVTVSPKTGQQADTVLYQNCVEMFARLAPRCMRNAIWIANQTTIPDLMTMSVPVGTGGAFVPAVQQSNGKFYLLTKEIVFTEKCPALGNKGDLMLTDLSQYSVGLRSEVSLDQSNAPGWLKDETSYRAIVRADGQGQWNAPITPKNGDSVSWCVALDNRA